MSLRFRAWNAPSTSLDVVLAVAVFGCGFLSSDARAELLTYHVGMATETWGDQGKGHQIWDYEFKQLIEKNLYKDGNPVYQDLEMVFNICYGGGMIDWITGHGGLKGNWSASSSVTARNTSLQEWTTSVPATPNSGGSWKNPGLGMKTFTTSGKTADQYSNGYSPQYIKAIEDNAALTVKKLHETAVERNFRNDKKIVEPGQYASSGAAADAMTIKGNADTKSQHAIAWSGGAVRSVDQHIYEKLIQVLEGVGYKGASGSIQKPSRYTQPCTGGVPIEIIVDLQ